MEDLLIKISIIGTFVPLVPLAVYWYTRKLQEPYMKYLALLLLFSFLTDFANFIDYLLEVYFQNNTFNFAGRLPDVYVLLSIFFIGLLYKNLFPDRFGRIFIAAMALVLVSTVVIYFGLNTKFSKTPSRVPVSLFVMVVTLSYFFQMMKTMPSGGFTKTAMFWVNSGLLLYYGGTILLKAFGVYIASNFVTLFAYFWLFHNLIGVSSQMLYAIGLGQVRRTRVPLRSI